MTLNDIVSRLATLEGWCEQLFARVTSGGITLPAGDLSGDGSSNADPTISNLTGKSGVVSINPAATLTMTESAPGAGMVPYRFIGATAGVTPWSMRFDGSDVCRTGFNVSGLDVPGDNQLWQGFVQSDENPVGTFSAIYHLQCEGPGGSFPTQILGGSYTYAGPTAPTWGLDIDMHGFGALALSDNSVTFDEFNANGENIQGTAWTVSATNGSWTLIAGSGGATIATTASNPITFGAGLIGLWTPQVTFNSRAGSQYMMVEPNAGLTQAIFSIGTATTSAVLQLAEPQGLAVTQSIAGETRYPLYGSTAGAAATAVPLGYTPPNGHTASIRAVWNARDASAGGGLGTSFSRTLEASLAKIGGVVSVEGSGTVNTTGDGSAALSTATVSLTVVGGVPNLSLNPPGGFADNLDWKLQVCITEN